MTSESKVQGVISSFICIKDPDIEHFLKDKAIQFEKSSKGKTYFLVDEECFIDGDFVILAYFTVALQVLKIIELGLSNRKIKELDGFAAKKDGSVITDFPVFLIGQLARNDAYGHCIDGKIILDHALSVIHIAQEKIGGRIILVECNNEPKLIKFYSDNGFTLIRQDEDKLIQLIRIIT